MKKFSRLTALLLAITMLVTSMPLMALADSITVDIDTWNSWVEEAQNAAANQTETVTTTVPVTGETSVVDRPVVEAALTAHAGTETSATQAATLPIAGKLVLKAFDGASSYQWQVKAGSQWANIVGDKGSTVTLTYAKIQNAISGSAAQVRCVMVVDGQDYVSATAQVTVDETVTYTTVETESTLTVTAEVPVRSNYALRNSGATTYNDTPSTYTVVINYLFEDNGIAADPYTASLAAGSNFNATVTFPTVQGYLPYVGENQQNSIDLSYTNINQNYTINVVYKPTNVNYTVIHYKQNLDDDKYTEADRETLQGLTKSEVPEVKKNYEGFYALLYEHPAIAADGSTLVEVYYDRYYYLMNFDLDGGYGVEPIYARYGAPIGNVGTPTKAGYSFQGWSLDGTNTVALPGEMPAENRTYKAVWQAGDTAKVTIVFWGENADNEEYSYIESSTVEMVPGSSFTYQPDGSLICALEEHEHNETCGERKCGLEEHTHSIDAGCYKLTCDIVGHTHENCTLECKHQHDLSCYYAEYGSLTETSGPDEIATPSTDGVYTFTTKPLFVTYTHYYLYLDGTWYKSAITDLIPISFSCNHTHNDSCYTCGLIAQEHVHNLKDCYTLECSKQEHVHTNECGYVCGKITHKHTEDCYMRNLDKDLWTFVRSDTEKVAADGSTVVNVYFDRVEKTLTFKYNYSNNNNSYQTTKEIKAKWGQKIANEYVAIANDAGSTFWTANQNGSGPYTNYFGVMPKVSATYYNRGASGNQGTMTYWGQDMNGEYTVKLFEVTGVGGYRVTDEDRYEFQGFTYDHGTANGSNCGGAEFFYNRNSYTLTFNDGYDDVRSESVLYEAPLSTYADYVPDVPSAYEPGSVKFGGWYLNPECTGEEYKLDEHKMPADNVLLYAKWKPVTHTVEFYLDKAAMDAGTKLSTHPDITVPHGSMAKPTPANPTNGSYTFVGWFYMEDGVEKAFDFANMPVNKDLQVYGKWSSNVLKEYTILYKYKDSEGNEIEIADPTKGSGLAGITKTFEAKGGTDLYADYQEGYFPVNKSHSLTIDINATEENKTNVYTFWYVQKDAVPYTVKYLNKATGLPVADEKTVSNNRKAVVTETFVPVSGYLPDAYQKRLVVSVDENGNPDTAKNVIIFYYTKDDAHAYYKITHYTENLAKDSQGNTTWTEYASSTILGNVRMTDYSAQPLDIDGFTYQKTEYVVSGVVQEKAPALTQNGLEINLYYVRNEYPYVIHHYLEGTIESVVPDETDKAKYGEVISRSPYTNLDYYEPVKNEAQTLNIRIEENDVPLLNVITFYYKEKEVTINYEVVGPTGCGTVSPTSETLKVLSGKAKGSTATANENFKFVGWYTDAACQTPVDSTWVDANNKIKPVKAEGAAWENGTTYYAKFVVDKAALTIEKTGMDSGESAIINVSGPGYDGKVVVPNGESVTLFVTCGEYTITEVGSWTNRYTTTVTGLTSEGKVTLTAANAEVSFENKKKNDKWLHDESAIENFTQTGTGN